MSKYSDKPHQPPTPPTEAQVEESLRIMWEDETWPLKQPITESEADKMAEYYQEGRIRSPKPINYHD